MTQAAHRLPRAGLCAAAFVATGCGGDSGAGGFFGGPSETVPPGPPAPSDKYSALIRRGESNRVVVLS